MMTLQCSPMTLQAADALQRVTQEDDDRLTVASAYLALRDDAARLAGAPQDIAPRVAILHSIYLESRGNHTFPELALHGALWAHGAVRMARTIGLVVSLRYALERRKRAMCLSLLQHFLAGLLIINREVFIDTYTIYYFTQRYGRGLAAHEILTPRLCRAMAAMHAATQTGTVMTPAEKRQLFLTCLQYEQDTMVAPQIERVVAHFDRPLLRAVLLRPFVRFAYFPRRTYCAFRDFADKEERIRHALRSYDLAAAAGWPAVASSIRDYGVVPAPFFDDPCSYARELKHRRGVV